MKCILSLADLKGEVTDGPSDCLPLAGIRGGKNGPRIPYYPFLLPIFLSLLPSFVFGSFNSPGLVTGRDGVSLHTPVLGEIQGMAWGLLWEAHHLQADLGIACTGGKHKAHRPNLALHLVSTWGQHLAPCP